MFLTVCGKSSLFGDALREESNVTRFVITFFVKSIDSVGRYLLGLLGRLNIDYATALLRELPILGRCDDLEWNEPLRSIDCA